jgi:lipoate-protein ligase A
MIYREMPAASVADELQRDDRAYYEAERAGGESLRFWIPDRVVVVLGRGNNADREVKSTNCAADARLPVLRSHF